MSNAASMSLEQRLGETLTRCLPKLGPDAKAQLQALIDPTALKVMAGVMVAWVVSHAFGIGEVIDIVVAGLGALAIGFAVFTGIDHLYDFASGVYSAKTDRDLDKAADHLSMAIAILGLQVVLAILFRGAKAPKTSKGGKLSVGGGPKTGGLRYKPTLTRDPTVPAGNGWTTSWGDIVVSSRGSATEQALVLLHERVHQFLTPRLYILRNFRVSLRDKSYVRSSLWRYLEEALAETIAQVGTGRFKQFFTGIRFPVKEGYVFLCQGGGRGAHFAHLGGYGAVTEVAGLLYNGVVAGVALEIWFQPDNVH